MALKQRLTAEEYLAIPEEPPYLEYVCGEVIPKAMPNRTHVAVAHRLAFLLELYRQSAGGFAGPEARSAFDEGGGRTGYRLPDYSYWTPGKPQGDTTTMLPPTLAVEVRSPGESLRDQREKCRYFRRYGVDVAWLVDPERRAVEVFDGERDGEVLTGEAELSSPHLPGFRLRLPDLFAVLDETG